MDELFETPMTLNQFLLGVERKMINDALRSSRFNETQAARRLGITYRALRHRLQRLREWSEAFTIEQKAAAWSKARMAAINLHGAKCQCCGKGSKDGVKINVDHIKPRERYPWLAYDVDNLQVLCADCNRGKGSDIKDWR